MLSGQCHCGSVRITLPSRPEQATICNCSLCRRIGAVWAYYQTGAIKVEGHPENTQAYVQGDKTLATVRCKTCGIVTHWEPRGDHPQMAVNMRNFSPTIMDGVVKRRFDGSDARTFIDEEKTRHSMAWPF